MKPMLGLSLVVALTLGAAEARATHDDLSTGLTPDPAGLVVPAAGGSVAFERVIANESAMAQVLRFWGLITGPDGTPMPHLLPSQVMLQPGEQVATTLDALDIPGFLLGGDYEYREYVQTVPGAFVSSLSFAFFKEFGFTHPSVEGLLADDALQVCLDAIAEERGWQVADQVTELSCLGRDVTSLEGVEFLLNLQQLELGPRFFLSFIQGTNDVSDLSPLGQLDHLSVLDLRNNASLTDVSPLAGVTSLQQLYLGFPSGIDETGTTPRGQLSDLSPLSTLVNLETLGIERQEITDLSPLFDLPSLEYLDARTNRVSELVVSSGFPALEFLQLDDNEISTISVPNSLAQLIRLELGINQVSDVAELASLVNRSPLQHLDLSGNQLSDLNPLATTAGSSLRILDLAFNPISDVSPMTGLTNLTSLSFLGCDQILCSDLDVLQQTLPDTAVSFLRFDEQRGVPPCLADPEPDSEPTEPPPARCGLGFEVALLLPGLMWLRRRSRRR